MKTLSENDLPSRTPPRQLDPSIKQRPGTIRAELAANFSHRELDRILSVVEELRELQSQRRR
jgi:hypothetical protein